MTPWTGTPPDLATARRDTSERRGRQRQPQAGMVAGAAANAAQARQAKRSRGERRPENNQAWPQRGVSRTAALHAVTPRRDEAPRPDTGDATRRDYRRTGTTEGDMTTRKKQTVRQVIITTQYRDLYYGSMTQEQIEAHAAGKKEIQISDCRHIAYWHGPTGGLTSLAVEGPDSQSRIGAPCEGTITAVAHVLLCTTEAAKRFAAVKP